MTDEFTRENFAIDVAGRIRSGRVIDFVELRAATTSHYRPEFVI